MFGELGFYISWIGTWLIFTSPYWILMMIGNHYEKQLNKIQKKTIPIRRWLVVDILEGQKVVCLD